jgi:Las17-binding protein actin regulator
MTDSAVEMLFSNNGSINLGADIGVAVGPLGRSLEGNVGASIGSVAPIYSYSQSKGLYAGLSLDGKVIVTRHDVNEKFYGREVSASELLSGSIPMPPAAQPLYDALARCQVYASGARLTRQKTQQQQQRETYDLDYEHFMRSTLPQPIMPPAFNDQHSYVSDITEF